MELPAVYRIRVKGHLHQEWSEYSDPWLDCPELYQAMQSNIGRALGDEAEIASEVESAYRPRPSIFTAWLGYWVLI